MRNLKKVLSLTLALVMMLGMMTFAGAAETKITAADFKDMDKVVNKEAVSLLVDLGVLNGIKAADGTYTFNPAGNIERGAYAKMIYAVMMASNNADVYKGVNTGLKDVAGHWAEGFIGYCVTTKLAVGNGNGTFTPNANITTVAASKMLLVALGYDAKASGYEGDDLWSINIMRDAQKAGLLNGVNQKAAENLTRDNAAQLIFNALFANTVVPSYQYDMGVKYLTKYEFNATTLGYENFNLVKVTGVVESTTNGELTLKLVGSTPADPLDVLRTGINGKKIPVATDLVGKKVVVYVKATQDSAKNYVFDSVYSSVAMAGTSVVLGTSMDGTQIWDGSWASGDRDLTTKNSGNKGFIAKLVIDADTSKYGGTAYLNGKLMDSGTDSTPDNDIVDAVETAAKKAGAIVELIDTDEDGLVDMIKVTEKKVGVLTGDVKTKTVNDVLQVMVPGVISTYRDAKDVVGYEGLKKDDVVLYYLNDTDGNDSYTAGETTYIEKAASVEGNVAATKGTSDDIEVKVGGTFYGNSGIGSKPLTGMAANDDVYTFYLDNNGTVVKKVAVSTKDNSKNAIFLSAGWAGNPTDISSAASYAQAKMLLADGTTEVVKLAKFDGLKVVAETEGGKVKYTILNGDTYKNHFVSYTVNTDGAYELKLATGETTLADDANAATAVNILNNTAKFSVLNTDATDAQAGIGNSATKFLVASKDGDNVVYKMYAGIAAVPAMTKVTGHYIAKDGIATLVYINAAGADSKIDGLDVNAVYAYIPDNTDFVSYPKYFEFVAFVNGEKTTVKVADKTAIAAADHSVFKFTTANTDGVYASGAVQSFVTGYPIASGGTLEWNSELYSYNADAKIYMISEDYKTVTSLTMDELKADTTDGMLVIADTSKVANTIFIHQVVKTEKAITNTVTGAETTTTNIQVYIDGTKVSCTSSGSVTAPTGTITTAVAGKAVTLKGITVSAGATYKVSPATQNVPAASDTPSTLTFKITVTAENGESVVRDYVLTFTKTTAPA